MLQPLTVRPDAVTALLPPELADELTPRFFCTLSPDVIANLDRDGIRWILQSITEHIDAATARRLLVRPGARWTQAMANAVRENGLSFVGATFDSVKFSSVDLENIPLHSSTFRFCDFSGVCWLGNNQARSETGALPRDIVLRLRNCSGSLELRGLVPFGDFTATDCMLSIAARNIPATSSLTFERCNLHASTMPENLASFTAIRCQQTRTRWPYGATVANLAILGGSMTSCELRGMKPGAGATITPDSLDRSDIAFLDWEPVANLPVPTVLFSANWHGFDKSDAIVAILMAVDALLHPVPDAFEAWATRGAGCPMSESRKGAFPRAVRHFEERKGPWDADLLDETLAELWLRLVRTQETAIEEIYDHAEPQEFDRDDWIDTATENADEWWSESCERDERIEEELQAIEEDTDTWQTVQGREESLEEFSENFKREVQA